MGLWKFLTEPAPSVQNAHDRRQSRLMASVLVVLIPTYVAMAAAAAATRSIAVSATDAVLGLSLMLLALISYGLSRTARYQRGAIVLSLTAIIGPAAVAITEPDPVRALYSAMIGLTGALYASFLASTKTTALLAVLTLLALVGVMTVNPAIGLSVAVIPFFFAIYVLGLTVVGARLRESQVRELEASAEVLRSIIDASQDAALIVDRAGKIAEWGQVATQLMGVPPFEAVGKALHAVLGTPVLDHFHGSPDKQELTVVRSDGTRKSCEALVAPLPDGRLAVFLRDVSERKQMEARLMMSDRLETMGRMVAGVAHEINNPLAYVSSNLNYLTSSLAQGEVERDELKTVLGETREGARRIQTIVQDLRIFSRSGEFEQVTPIQIEAVLDSVVTIALHRLREAKATVVRDYGKVGGVYGVESRLAQVFLNLIVNASQALGETIERREIVLSTRRENDRVIISVRDFGPGIPEPVRARLFSPFFTTKPAGQGTGLGLYISHNIITALRGELRVRDGKPGAIFEVVLPAVV